MQTYQNKRKAPAARPQGTESKEISRSQMLHLSGAGAPQPMSPDLREKFEPGFAADFSNIRISRGHIPEEMGVQAVAQGTDILLDSRAGMDVLGHELAHVVQQAQGRVAEGYPVVENAALEHEADVMGQRAAAGLEAQVGSAGGFGGQTMAIAPMSGATAPAQCKKKGDKGKNKKMIDSPDPQEENLELAPMDLSADMEGMEDRPQPAFNTDVGRMAEMIQQDEDSSSGVLDDDIDMDLPLAPWLFLGRQRYRR